MLLHKKGLLNYSKLIEMLCLVRRRLLSSTTSVAVNTIVGDIVPNAEGYYIDAYGRKLRKNENAKVPFFYDEDTFESYEQVMRTTAKPQYSTSWEDPKFPGWVQFMDSTGKRPYYVDMANPISGVRWAPPGDSELDVFKLEYDELNKPFASIPAEVMGASFARRASASVVDAGISIGVGMVFGALVYIDLGKLMEAGQGVGFSSLITFLARDAINLRERGTRSLGKQFMKLEIVKRDGTLPTRWNTAFRQFTLPMYILGPQLFFPQIVVLPIVELGMFLFTQRGWRLGDLVANTSVVDEQPDRAARFAEKCQREDADDAKD